MTDAPPPPPPNAPPPPGATPENKAATRKGCLILLGVGVVLIALLAVAGALGVGDEADDTAVATDTTVETTTTTAPERRAATTTSTSTTTTTTEPPRPAVPVIDVVDGDTLKVTLAGTTETIRIIGIDTPETKHPTKPVQCWGPEASARAVELLAGQTVTLEHDPAQGERDRYDRMLAYVWLPDGRLYSEVMIGEGHGHEYTYDGPYTHREAHLAAQGAAQAGGLGLWSAASCGGDTTKPVPTTAPPTTAPPPAPAPPPSTAPSVGPWRNCSEARAAGAAPVYRGDPRYGSHLDRDGDGIGCE